MSGNTANIYLSVHSKDRDVSLYPKRGQFRINLYDQCNLVLKDIVSMSLYTAILPNHNNVSLEPYLLLNIDELSGAAFHATNDNSRNAFALLQMDRPVQDFINAKMDSCRHVSLQGTAVGANVIGSMTISVSKQDGTLFDFGTDTVNSMDLNKQLTFIFEIKKLVPS